MSAEQLFPLFGFHVSFLLGIFGVAMQRSERNHLFGIRTKYTLKSEENWKHVHQIASKRTTFAGIVGALIFASSYWLPIFRKEPFFWMVLTTQFLVLFSAVFVRRAQDQNGTD